MTEREKFEAWYKDNISKDGPWFKDAPTKSGYAFKSSFAQAAWKGWQARAAQDEWISVEDELPGIGGSILVFEERTGAMYVETMTEYALAVIGGEEYSAHYMEITHWKPLPEEPKE